MPRTVLTVDAEGSVTLPGDVVREMNLAEGDELSYEVGEGRLVLKLTGPAQGEQLDLVDENDMVVGVTVREPGQHLQKNVRVVNAFLVNSQGELWIPRRTSSKKTFPGCLDMSVGGYVQSGESYEQAFRRETFEELNLHLDAVPWREIAYFSPFQTTLSAFMKVYELRTDQAPDFNADDFSGGEWLRPAALLARIDAGDPAKGDLREIVERCYGAL